MTLLLIYSQDLLILLLVIESSGTFRTTILYNSIQFDSHGHTRFVVLTTLHPSGCKRVDASGRIISILINDIWADELDVLVCSRPETVPSLETAIQERSSLQRNSMRM